LDLGKAVAALMTNNGDVFEYLEIIGKGMPIEKLPMPHIAVPTTSGTGSECTKNAVLKSLSHGRKASMRHDSMLPTIAIIDPCLSVSCPQQVRFQHPNIPYPLPSSHIPNCFTLRRMQGWEKSNFQSFRSPSFDALILLTHRRRIRQGHEIFEYSHLALAPSSSISHPHSLSLSLTLTLIYR
jgi:hypothetical protein